VTHFHPDHAGLVQELKNQDAKLILPECQKGFISTFGEHFKGKSFPYVEIKQNGNILLKLDESRKFLFNVGLNGEILHTPGHTDDSVTLILDEGFAFTGDLHPGFMNTEDLTTRESWDKIHQHKTTRIFPGHGR
jgi:glyoxylase-like metal-dependent hydrolase (beta-lactamase superfamily II)